MPGSEPSLPRVTETKGELQTLLNAMPVGVLLVHADGRIELANARALDLFGYTADELVGENVDVLVPESVRKGHVHHRGAYVVQPEQRPMGFGRDLYAQRKDGTTFPVEIGLSPAETENGMGTICTIIDITERKRLDGEKDHLLWTLEEKNAEITALYRVSELTRAGKTDPAMLAEIAEAIRSGLFGAPVSGVRITLDGAASEDAGFVAAQEALCSGILVDGRARGKIEAFLSDDHARDGRKRRDGDFARLMGTFAAAVGESLERSEALAKVIHASQLASIGELAAGVGHEVNNPINGIINCVDILLRNADAGTKEHRYLDLIKQEAYRISSIVGSLLAFARSGRSKPTPADLRVVLENVLVLSRKRIEKSQTLLQVEINENLPVVHCQPEQMQQVLLNLVLNALHALDERYPQADPNKTLLISARQVFVKDVPHVEVVVEDHGTGIRPEHIDRVFDPFFSTKGQQGTGLGLSVSLNIVRGHGGWISVESEPGTFTRFIVQCPVRPAECAATPSETS